MEKSSTVYVGPDVHNDSIGIAAAEAGHDAEVRHVGTTGGDLVAQGAAQDRQQGPSPAHGVRGRTARVLDLYGQPVDMGKSFDGLYAIARSAFPEDPTAGGLYVFVNRRGGQVKVLYFERSGWCVWAKRLEAGQFIGDWSRA